MQYRMYREVTTAFLMSNVVPPLLVLVLDEVHVVSCIVIADGTLVAVRTVVEEHRDIEAEDLRTIPLGHLKRRCAIVALTEGARC
jgi:hypothetical protein